MESAHSVSDRKKYIVHITTVHPALDGRIFYRQAQTVGELGYHVTVCGIHDRDDVVDGIRIRALRDQRNRTVRMMVSWIRGLWIVCRTRADLYQFHDPELLPCALIAKMILRRNVVYDAHEDVSLLLAKDWMPRWLRGPSATMLGGLDRFCARHLDGILSPTRLIHEKYQQIARRAEVFINLPAPAFLKERDAAWRPFDQRRNEIIHLGTLSVPRMQFVCQLAQRFLETHTDWTWRLVGVHDNIVRWFEENVTGDIRQRFYCVGKVPHMKVAEYLCRARIGMNYHPLGKQHIQMAIPLKVFEYLACGLSVVTTRVPLLVELVKDCPATALTDENLVTFLQTLDALTARGDLGSLCDEARTFSDEKFNCRLEGRRLAALYESIWNGSDYGKASDR